MANDPASARRPGLREKIALTYDNAKMTDGVGAQLQRILGIYAVTRLVGLSYVHTPIGYVEYQGLAAVQGNRVDRDYPRAFNELVDLAADVPPSTDFHTVEVPYFTLATIDQWAAAFDAGETGGKPVLAKVVVPYGVADGFPDCYEVCKAISPFESPPLDGRVLRVALHVRRGEILLTSPGRVLANAYYVRVALRAAEILQSLGIAFQIELHTEVATSEFVVPEDYPGLIGKQTHASFRPQMSPLAEFEALPNLVRCINEPTIDCLRKLATADVLVMSRSSFSYTAAILNRTGIVLYHPFWHTPLLSWLVVEPDEGRFDRQRFRDAVVALQMSPTTLPLNRYVSLVAGGDDDAIARHLCAAGWRPAASWGIGPSGASSGLRFRTDAPDGRVVNMVLRLVAIGAPCRLRIASGSGPGIEVALTPQSDQLATVPCAAESGGRIRVRMLTLEAAATPGDPASMPAWGLKGILCIAT